MFACKSINAGSFKKYGKIIEYPGKAKAQKTKNLFCKVVVESKAVGWRIAYLVVRDTSIQRLEQHPGVMESFEPVTGEGFLCVSRLGKAEDLEIFLLDRPVVLFKNIWHGVFVRGKEAEIKITENASVSCAYRELPFAIGFKALKRRRL